jgi:hypothetical protein
MINVQSIQKDIRKIETDIRKQADQARKQARRQAVQARSKALQQAEVARKQAETAVVGAFDKAEDFVETLRPVMHDAVNDLREPVVNFVTTTVDGALEIRERGENIADTVKRDAEAVRTNVEGWVKKIMRA